MPPAPPRDTHRSTQKNLQSKGKEEVLFRRRSVTQRVVVGPRLAKASLMLRLEVVLALAAEVGDEPAELPAALLVVLAVRVLLARVLAGRPPRGPAAPGPAAAGAGSAAGRRPGSAAGAGAAARRTPGTASPRRPRRRRPWTWAAGAGRRRSGSWAAAAGGRARSCPGWPAARAAAWPRRRGAAGAGRRRGSSAGSRRRGSGRRRAGPGRRAAAGWARPWRGGCRPRAGSWGAPPGGPTTPGPRGELRSAPGGPGRLLMLMGPPPEGEGSMGWWPPAGWYSCWGPGTRSRMPGGVPERTAPKCGGIDGGPGCLYGDGILPVSTNEEMVLCALFFYFVRLDGIAIVGSGYSQ